MKQRAFSLDDNQDLKHQISQRACQSAGIAGNAELRRGACPAEQHMRGELRSGAGQHLDAAAGGPHAEHGRPDTPAVPQVTAL